MKKLLFLLSATLLMTACVEDPMEGSAIKFDAPATFEAVIGADTRTDVGEADADGMRLVRWHSGDPVSLFPGQTGNHRYTFEGEHLSTEGLLSLDTSTAVEQGGAISANYAIYPYAPETTLNGGQIIYQLPAQQTYAVDSFGPGANPMVALSSSVDDQKLFFKNVCGYLKLQLTGNDVTVKKITVTGNNGEMIAGKIKITPSVDGAPVVDCSEATLREVELVSEEGVTLTSTPTTFWIVLPEMTFEKGLTILVEGYDANFPEPTSGGANKGYYAKTTTKAIEITRAATKTMNPLAVTFAAIPVGTYYLHPGYGYREYYKGADITAESIKETVKFVALKNEPIEKQVTVPDAANPYCIRVNRMADFGVITDASLGILVEFREEYFSADSKLRQLAEGGVTGKVNAAGTAYYTTHPNTNKISIYDPATKQIHLRYMRFSNNQWDVMEETLTLAGFEPKHLQTEIEVMSFNNNNDNWDSRANSIFSMINAEKPAVIGMQEVYEDKDDDFTSACSGYGFYGVKRGGSLLDGLGIYEMCPLMWRTSKVEVVKKGTFWLSKTPAEESKLEKGDIEGYPNEASNYNRICSWILCKDVATSVPYFVVNTHLDNKHDDAGAAAAVRKEQMLILMDYMRNTVQRGVLHAYAGKTNDIPTTDLLPMFVTGDFNSIYSETCHQLLRNASYFGLTHAGSMESTMVGEGSAAFDHVYYLASAFKRSNFEVLKTYSISDHYPVVGTFTLNKK